MRTVVITVLFAFPVFAQQPQSHSCTPAPKTQRTIMESMNLHINMSNPVKALTGIVSYGGEIDMSPAGGVLVEIFPARKAENWYPGDPKHRRKRLHACFTGANGSFEFNVPSGFYYIVASEKNYKTTTALVLINRRRGEAKPLIVPLEVGM